MIHIASDGCPLSTSFSPNEYFYDYEKDANYNSPAISYERTVVSQLPISRLDLSGSHPKAYLWSSGRILE